MNNEARIKLVGHIHDLDVIRQAIEEIMSQQEDEFQDLSAEKREADGIIMDTELQFLVSGLSSLEEAISSIQNACEWEATPEGE